MHYFPHTCYFLTVDQKLAYDGGTAAFTLTKTLTGATSHATGTIKSIVGNATSGYLILSNVSGTFQNDEAIADNNTSPGAAVANGANAAYVDSYGKQTTTQSATATYCRFVQSPTGGGDERYGWGGSYPAVQFPAGTALTQADEGVTKILTTQTGMARTFLIEKVMHWNPMGTVLHITCSLKAVT